MKYDFSDIKPDDNSCNGIILRRIPHGASVLEFGCATGYMTRALKEYNECSVSVIEIDREAYEYAIPYANDGICCDIETDEWCNYYRGKQFDCVLVANVLEHIRNPLETLIRIRTHLKQDGLLFIVVPNVAHNDVIINLISDDWRYTQLGLLDDTHLHFFAWNNIIATIKNAGYEVFNEEEIFFKTGETEQNPNTHQIPSYVLQYLQQRKRGEIYQFVFTARQIQSKRKDKRASSSDIYLQSVDKYIHNLEKNNNVAQSYIVKLERERSEAHAYIEKLEKERSEAHAYIEKLERERSEAHAYITKLENKLSDQHI